MKRNINKKQASVTTITLFAIMCILFPMLAIIYDIGMIHIYKQDLKNIQELAGTACAPNAESKGLSEKCIPLAKRYVAMNLTGKGISGLKSGSQIQITKLRVTEGIGSCSSSKTGKSRLCTEGGGISENNVIAKLENGTGSSKQLVVNIVNIKYKPLFLNKKMFQFGNTKPPQGTPDDNGAIPLTIPKSKFSGTYQSNG